MAKKAPVKMRFLVVDPIKQNTRFVVFESFEQALRSVGVAMTDVQHCPLNSWVGVAVYQHGLYRALEEQHLFSIGRVLFSGPAIVYGRNHDGGICSFSSGLHSATTGALVFYDDYKKAMQAVEDELIDQPSVKIGGDVVWVWPQPMFSNGDQKKRKESK